VTVRLLVQLLEAGDEAERAATPAAQLSPLFSGELENYVRSVTTLAAPHNGSSLLENGASDSNSMESMFSIMGLMSAAFPPLGWIYPFRLGQFGVDAAHFYANPFATYRAHQAMLSGSDYAAHDLSIDGAAEVNKRIECQPGVYYFSYAAQASRPDAAGNQVPTDVVTFMFRSGAEAMGQKRPTYTTPGGIVVDDSWLPNDGMVNLISAQYPFHEPHKAYDPGNVRPGIWNVMPTITKYEHADFCGGPMRLGGALGIRAFYLELAQMLVGLEN
jgi:triacylglycerol lipase